MKPGFLPPIEWLQSRFSYNADTGEIRNLYTTGRAVAGYRAGTPHVSGYRKITFTYGGRSYSRPEHRVAWALHHGELPPEDMRIDHVNHDRSDNRSWNLRLATSGDNNRNHPNCKRSDDLTGYTPIKQRGATRYQAQIRDGGRSHYLGLYDTPEEAAAAYEAARERLA